MTTSSTGPGPLAALAVTDRAIELAAARLRSSARVQTNEALVIVALIFIVTPVAMTFPIMSHDIGFLDALFEVVSAVGTVGLSTGIVSHDLATGLKLMLCLDMLLGRLEIIALLVLLYPRTWFGHRAESL